jgi:hypothetical protein
MRASPVVLAAASLLVAVSGANAQQSSDRTRIYDYSNRNSAAPYVSVWIDRYSFTYGQRLRAYFQSDPGAYVTVLRISTSGDLQVLYPRRPSLQQQYDEQRLVNDEIPYSSDPAFWLNEPDGVGFVFAVASFEPFDYSEVSSRDQWNTYQLAGTRYEDPSTVINRFIGRTLRPWDEYSSDFIQYEVSGTNFHGRRYANSNYDDIYYQCLGFFSAASLYCRQYAQFGFFPFFPFFPRIVGRVPRQPVPVTPTPTTGNRMRPPSRVIPDPNLAHEGVKPETANQRSASNAIAQRTWWNSQRREADRGSRAAVPSAPRTDPQDAAPQVYRGRLTQPRIDVRPNPGNEGEMQRRYEPGMQPGYDPMRQRRYEPPPQQRRDPAPPQGTMPRYEPPVRRYEPPPVQRSEPPARFEPAPQPPPPPVQRTEPVDRGDPAPRQIHPERDHK